MYQDWRCTHISPFEKGTVVDGETNAKARIQIWIPYISIPFSRKRSRPGWYWTMTVNSQEKLQTWPNAYYMFFHDSISACSTLPLKIIFAINIHLAIRKKNYQCYHSMCLSLYRILAKQLENMEETSSKFSVLIKYAPCPLYWFSSSTRYSWCHD